MLRTNVSFINQSAISDELMQTIKESSDAFDSAICEYEMSMKNIEFLDFFEAGETEGKKDKAKAGLLESIGNAILAVIQGIGHFIQRIAGIFTKNVEDTRTVEERYSKMVKEYPWLKDETVHGLEKGWYTTEDIVSYEKDVQGLFQMLKQKKIDHQTFADRLREKTKKFKEKPLFDDKNRLTTVAAAIGAIGVLHKSFKSSIDALKKMSEGLNTLSSTYNDSYTNARGSGMNALKAAKDAAVEAVSAVTKESEDKMKTLQNTVNELNTKMDKLNTRVKEQGDDIDAISDDIDRLDYRTASNRGRIQSIENRLNNKGNGNGKGNGKGKNNGNGKGGNN